MYNRYIIIIIAVLVITKEALPLLINYFMN